jgi:hypothetical protein
MWTLPVASAATSSLLCSSPRARTCFSGAPAFNRGVLIGLGLHYAMLSFGLTVLVRGTQLPDLRRTGPVLGGPHPEISCREKDDRCGVTNWAPPVDC